MNDISTKQNEPQSLTWLAAQRQAYADAKTITGVQATMLVGVPFVVAIAVAVKPELKVWGAFLSLVVALVDFAFLENAQRQLKHLAASVQERFDCHVLTLPWNSWIAGDEPDHEDIHRAAAKHDRINVKNGRAPLQDWYATGLRVLPLELARIACQRASCRWDSQLRRHYVRRIAALMAVMSIVVIALGLVREMTLEHFVLAIVAPLTPTLLWGIREVRKQQEAAQAADNLKHRASQLWKEAISGQVATGALEQQSRQFQDANLLHRRQSPFVFDFVYSLLRDKFETEMYASADQMVAEFQAAQH